MFRHYRVILREIVISALPSYPGVDSASDRNKYKEFLGGKGGRCVGLITLPRPCADVLKSGSLNLLEPYGPVQACNGIALPLPLPCQVTPVFQMQLLVIQLTIKMFHMGFMQVLML
jgi:hypothetical protein